ncbi:hypothetical protein SCUCBS95973_004104 [Sporothrix curviconia]|uniref:Xylanolytic transcriptional activator regulatory domain-containing protein n=1 Tax=Sporothrix curviconia TaxID=1260050 RepID=A0ABP0BLE7_9PEZI
MTQQGDVNSDACRAERYVALVRQLPPRNYIHMLVQLFFSDLEWYYGVIDEKVFYRELHAWNNLPYAALKRGPHSLPTDMRAFPALLFQVIAHALLFSPTRLGPALADIKYAPGMTLADVASEYSEAGEAVVLLLRKGGDATMAQVQAGLLRASFLKSTASVVQAWHTIGATIRDGQEWGLHTVPGNIGGSPLDSVDAAALDGVEYRARLWLMLHLWDGHMGVVLGRPLATRLNCKDWLDVFVEIGRGDPTPFRMFLLGYDVAYRYLQDIESLANSSTDATRKQDILDRAASIDTAITDGLRNLPTWAKDDITDPALTVSHPWLPSARETLLTEVNFVLLAVHRPFVSLSQRSRDQARQAALQILAAQRRLFGMSEPREYLPFNLIFATFDAMVLLATLYILFPGEIQSPLAAAELFTSMEWGLARLETMKMDGRNKLAACAFDAVQSLYKKMQKQRKKRPREEEECGSGAVAGLATTEPSVAAGSEAPTSESDGMFLEDDDWADLQELGDLPFALFPNGLTTPENTDTTEDPSLSPRAERA